MSNTNGDDPYGGDFQDPYAAPAANPFGDPGPMGPPMGSPMGAPMGSPMGAPMGSPMGAPEPMGAGAMTSTLAPGESPTMPMDAEAPVEEAGPAAPITIAQMARVDLLPLEIVESRGFARVRRGVVALVLVAALIAAGGVYWAQRGVSGAQTDLDAAQAEQRQSLADQTQFATLPALQSQLDAAKQARLSAMSQDILFYRLLNDLRNSLPNGVALESSNITLSSAGAAATTTGDATAATGAAGALTPTGIGTLQLTGTATSYSLLATWLNTAGEVNGVTGVTLTSATETSEDTTGTQVSFNATAVLTDKALSNRYTKEG